ncbi:hypothetical protein B0H13DRAFT_2373183 [Mycena leptocephala]|nr:hypothetical protein B0H13DRAFT_2373183 [Mycena leptocephala]
MATRFPLRARCFPHARLPHACSLFPVRPLLPRASSSTSHFLLCLALSAACSRFPARPLTAVSCTLTPARISTARSLFPACPFAARPLAVSHMPAAASRFLLRLTLPPPPRASSSTSRFPLRLALPPLPRAPLRLAWLCFASPAKPSQAPNMIKTGYRTSRV